MDCGPADKQRYTVARHMRRQHGGSNHQRRDVDGEYHAGRTQAHVDVGVVVCGLPVSYGCRRSALLMMVLVFQWNDVDVSTSHDDDVHYVVVVSLLQLLDITHNTVIQPRHNRRHDDDDVHYVVVVSLLQLL